MSDAIIRQFAGAIAANRKTDAPEESSTVDTAALKLLEATIVVRLANMSDEQRTEVINSAIDILRTNKRRAGSRSGGKTDPRCLV